LKSFCADGDTQMLRPDISKWWDMANARRQRLIVQKHRGRGLIPREEKELEMLQIVAEAIMNFGSAVFCRRCGGELEKRDLGFFPTHECKVKTTVRAK